MEVTNVFIDPVENTGTAEITTNFGKVTLTLDASAVKALVNMDYVQAIFEAHIMDAVLAIADAPALE